MGSENFEGLFCEKYRGSKVLLNYIFFALNFVLIFLLMNIESI